MLACNADRQHVQRVPADVIDLVGRPIEKVSPAPKWREAITKIPNHRRRAPGPVQRDAKGRAIITHRQ